MRTFFIIAKTEDWAERLARAHRKRVAIEPIFDNWAMAWRKYLSLPADMKEKYSVFKIAVDTK